MSEEVVQKTTEETVQDQKSFNDYVGSQEYINHMNAEKSKWANDAKAKDVEREQTLRGTLRDELMKELNPEETQDQKDLRELKEARKADLQERDKLVKEKELTKLAKEKQFDFGVERADRYSSFGDDAEARMMEDFEWMKSTIESEIDKRLKGSFSKDTPAKGVKEDDYNFAAEMEKARDKIK